MKLGCLILLICAIISSCDGDKFSSWPMEITSGTRLNINCETSKEFSSHLIEGVPIVVLCRTKQDLLNLQKLNDEVFDRDIKDRWTENVPAQDSNVFIVIPVTERFRCQLEFVPDSGFNQQDSLWFGGFHCPCSSAVFDMAGRQIKPGAYSPSKFPTFIGNLSVPKYRKISKYEVEFE